MKYPKFVVPLSDNLTVRMRSRVELKSRIEPRFDPSMHIEWFKDDVPIRSSNRVHVYFDRGYAALVISGFEERDNGNYTCVATNSCGSARVKARLELDSRYAMKKHEDSLREEKIKRLLKLKDTMKKADAAEAERKAQYMARIKAKEEAELEAMRQAEKARRDARAELAKQQARERIEASEKAERERMLQSQARQYQVGTYASRHSGNDQQVENLVKLGADGRALLWSPYRTVEDTKLLKKERTIYETIIEYEPTDDKRHRATGVAKTESGVKEEAISAAAATTTSNAAIGHSFIGSLSGQLTGYRGSSSSALGYKFAELTDWRARALAAYEAMSESERRRTGWAKYGYATGQNKLLAETLARTQIKPYREVEDTIILRKELTIYETIREYEPMPAATDEKEANEQSVIHQKLSTSRKELDTEAKQIEDAISLAGRPVVVSDFTVTRSSASGTVPTLGALSQTENLTESAKVDESTDVSPASSIWVPYRTIDDTVLFKRERTIYETIIEYEPFEEKPVIKHDDKKDIELKMKDLSTSVEQRTTKPPVTKVADVVPESGLRRAETRRMGSRLRGGECDHVAQVTKVDLQPSRIPRIIYNKPELKQTTSSQDYDSSKQSIEEDKGEYKVPSSTRLSRIDSTLLSKYPRFAMPLEDNLRVRERSRVELRSRLIPRDDATMKIEWFKDDVPLPQSDRVCAYYNRGYAALIIHDFDESDNGVYRCVASNCSGTDRVEARLQVGRPASRDGTSLEHRRQLERIRAEARKVEREIAATQAEAAARTEQKAKQEAEARRNIERMRHEARLERERILAEARLRSRENSMSPMRMSSLRRSVSSDTGRFRDSPIGRASSVNKDMDSILSRSLSRSEQRARERGSRPNLPVATPTDKSEELPMKIEKAQESALPIARRLRGGEVGQIEQYQATETEPTRAGKLPSEDKVDSETKKLFAEDSPPEVKATEGKYWSDNESNQTLNKITTPELGTPVADAAQSESDGFEEDSFIYADLKKSESPSVDESILKELDLMRNTTDPREARRRVVLSPRTSDNSNDSGR